MLIQSVCFNHFSNQLQFVVSTSSIEQSMLLFRC